MTNVPISAPIARQALFDTLVAGYTVDGKQTVQVYRQPQGLKINTCLILGECLVDFTSAMAKGIDVYDFTVYAAIPPDTISGFDVLDSFVSGNAGLSVREIIFANEDLGYPGQISAAVLNWNGWGGLINIAGNECVAARCHIRVAVDGDGL